MNNIEVTLARLRAKHRTVSAEVERMTKSRVPSDVQLQEMKKKKLRLKDQIARLEAPAQHSMSA